MDTKKRELVGPYKNAAELNAKGDPNDVNVHDFIDEEKGRATPYGVYDLKKNEAWVSVGISHDTGEFAVQTIRTWWTESASSRRSRVSRCHTADHDGGSSSKMASKGPMRG